MKISKRTGRKRSAVSQSLDLFIIIAAVLGVGAIVTATMYGLINSGASQYNIQLVSLTVVSGSTLTSGASFSPTLTFAVKNAGSQAISIGATSTVTIKTNSLTWSGTSSGSCTGTPTSVITDLHSPHGGLCSADQ